MLRPPFRPPLLVLALAALTALGVAATASALTIDAATIAFNPKKADAFTVKGRFAAVALANVASVTLTFGAFSQTVPLASFTVKKGTLTFKGPKGAPGLATLVLDGVKGKFAASGKNLTLGAFDNPAAFHLTAGAVLDECSTLAFTESPKKRKLAGVAPACGFAGLPTAAPATFFVSTPTDVRVQVPVVDDLALDLASLVILRLDAALQPVGPPVCTLHDDGSPTHGDATAVDGVFSCRFVTTEPQAAHVRYAARALRGTVPVLSPSFFLDAVTPLTDAEITTVMTTQDAAGDLWDAAVVEHGLGKKALKQTVAGILELPGVASATIAADGVNIAIEYSNGLAGGLDLDPVGTAPVSPLTVLRAAGAASADGASDGEGPTIVRADGADPAASTATALSAVQASATSPVVGNNKVLIWSAFENENSIMTEATDAVRTVFESATCPVFEVTVLKNEQCTLASIASFQAYGTVVIMTHGAQPQKNGDVAFMSREKATLFSTWYSHATDLKLRRLLVYEGRRTEKQGYFVFFPSFVASVTTGRFPNSVIFAAACTGAANRTMASPFFANGALAYVGFSATVHGIFLRHVVPTFFQALIDPPRTAAGALAAVPHKTMKSFFAANHLDPKILPPDAQATLPTTLTLLRGDERVTYPCAAPAPGLVETINVPAGAMSHAVGTAQLEAGASYRLVVSGSARSSFQTDFTEVDNMYCFSSSASFCQSGPFPIDDKVKFYVQTAGEEPGFGSLLTVLELTGATRPPYNPAHTYEYAWDGEAGKLWIETYPQDFPDTGPQYSGGFTVQIFRD